MRRKGSSALPEGTRKRLESLRSVDVVVGVPSFNCAHTVNYVIYQTAKGLAESFSNRNSVIIVSDGGSSDGTIEVVKAIKIPWRTKIIPTPYIGTRGKGTALKAIFEAMICLDAQAVMVVDSDLRSITPQWVNLLLSSALKGTGLVTPLYTRHKYDGTITNFLCYPFTRALYGKRIRQPIGGDFGLSKDLVEKLLSSSLWDTPYVPRFGIDIFETSTALGEGFKVKQASLGSKVHDPKNPSRHLASMFHEVAGAMFFCAKIYEDTWRNIKGSKPVEVIKEYVPTITPEAIKVNPKEMLQEYTSGFQRFRHTYERVLSSELLRDLKDLPIKKEEYFEFPSEYWAECVYSFAASFKREPNVKERSKLLEALRILWLGRVASFILETVDFNASEAEIEIEKQAEVFEELKSHLVNAY